MPGKKCANCGAVVNGLVCVFCGTPLDLSGEEQAQKAALEKYHHQLRSADKIRQETLLKGGFLPDHPKLIIDAGLVCVSFMDEDEVNSSRSDAAAHRLEALMMKLALQPRDPEIQKAATMLDDRLQRYHRSQSRAMIYGFIAIGAAVLIIIGLIAYLKS
jgi:hypothetical protein